MSIKARITNETNKQARKFTIHSHHSRLKPGGEMVFYVFHLKPLAR